MIQLIPALIFFALAFILRWSTNDLEVAQFQMQAAICAMLMAIYMNNNQRANDA